MDGWNKNMAGVLLSEPEQKKRRAETQELQLTSDTVLDEIT